MDFVETYLALHEAGTVAVPLERDCPEETFQRIKRLLDTTPLPDDACDVLFTTGTTGESKGVIISREATRANAENLIDAQGYHEGLTFLLCGPLNHIGTLSKILPTVLTGGTLRVLDGMKDMKAFFEAIAEAPGKVATFLVPTTLRLLLQLASDELARCADKIEFIETGAAPIAQADMEALCRLLPTTRLYNTYASTETGIIATHDYNHDLCQAGCLGRPMKHSSIEITAEERIVCRGKTLMIGYIGDAARTAEILYDGALHTHDCGRLDSEGRLHLTGRDGDTINIGGYKIAPTEVEEAALAIPGIADCICIAAPHPLRGTVLKLLMVASGDEQPTVKDIVKALKKELERYKLPQLYEFVSHIERTYNGKLNRKKYLP